WPFFDERHAKLAAQADAWARNNLGHAHGDNADAICRRLVQDLGCAGYLNYAVTETPDVRSIALLREVFAYHAGLADFAFVMQGLGSSAIALAGSDELKRKYVPAAARGDAIAAFALSEPDAGSDVQAMSTRARRSALRAARSTRRSRTPRGGASLGRRSAISSSPRRSSPTWPRRSTRARSSLIGRRGCATRVKRALHVKRRWRKCTPPRPRSRWSTTRSRSWAASA